MVRTFDPKRGDNWNFGPIAGCQFSSLEHNLHVKMWVPIADRDEHSVAMAYARGLLAKCHGKAWFACTEPDKKLLAKLPSCVIDRGDIAVQFDLERDLTKYFELLRNIRSVEACISVHTDEFRMPNSDVLGGLNLVERFQLAQPETIIAHVSYFSENWELYVLEKIPFC